MQMLGVSYLFGGRSSSLANRQFTCKGRCEAPVDLIWLETMPCAVFRKTCCDEENGKLYVCCVTLVCPKVGM